MIEANHKKFAHLIFNFYITRLLKKNFSHFFFVGSMPPIDEKTKLIVTPNHISWWDGFFIYFISKKFIKRKIHVLMLEEQLIKYWFFRFVGAFSIDLQNKYSMLASLKYARKISDDVNNFVVIYPQGKIEPFDRNPLELKEGIKLILKNNDDVKVLPVIFKIQFDNEKNPDVYVKFGEPQNGTEVLKNFGSFVSGFQNCRNSLDEISKSQHSFINLFDEL